jgi:phage portal protein BeeE/2'-5' RNA ligase
MMPDLFKFLKEDSPEPRGEKATLSQALGALRTNRNLYTDVGGDLYPSKTGADFANNTVSIVYRATTYIADFVGMLEWQIANKTTGEILATNKDPEGHPLAVAMVRQRKRSKQTFFSLWSRSLSLAGETYIEPIRERFGRRYIGVDWLMPALTEPYTPFGILEGFYYHAHARQEFFEVDELVYDHTYNAWDENRGWSPVMAAMNEVNLSRDSLLAFQAWFRNGMVPPVIYSPKGDELGVTKARAAAWEDLKLQLKEKHRGASNAYRAMVVNWPIDINTTDTPKIEGNVDLMEFWEGSIARSYGLPPVVLGDPSATPFKDAPEILASAWNGAIEPQTMRITEAVNTDLMPFFDDSKQNIFAFVTQKYEQLGENLVENNAMQLELYNSGAITLQTYRERTGAAHEDEDEGWKTLLPMVKVEGIPVPVPLKEVPNLWQKFLPTPPGQQAPVPNIPKEPPPAPTPTPLTENIIMGASKSFSGIKSAYISLDLKEDKNITDLLTLVKNQLPDDLVEYVNPDEYHLTLVHMPNLGEGEMLDEITEGIIPRPLQLKIKGLSIMGDKNALVAEVELSDELKMAQYDAYSQAAANEVKVSEFHEPKAFIPHITLGYIRDKAEVDIDDLEVKLCDVDAHDVKVSVKQDEIYKDIVSVKMISQKSAIAELKQWGRFKKKAAKSGSTKSFNFMKVRPSVVDHLSGLDTAGKSHIDIVGEAIKLLSEKAIATTKRSYLNSVGAMIQEARAGKLTQTKFRNNMRNLTKNTISRAYLDGLEDAGVFEDTTPETKEAIRQLKLEPTSFVKDFAAKLFSEEGITDEEANGKPEMWYAGSISQAYNAGLMAGNENGMYEFGGDDGLNTCRDCERLQELPDRHRLKAWDRRGLNLAEGAFVGQKTKCGGWKCLHLLKRATGRAQGSF